MNRAVRTGGVTAVWALALTACGGGDMPVKHAVIEPDAASLRAAFNADSGKVRALFLASPT